MPADANAIARECVEYLSNRLYWLKKREMDATSRAHLNDVQVRITKALDAEYRIGDVGGGAFHEAPFQAPLDDKAIPVLPRK